jgi:hypothetical protein
MAVKLWHPKKDCHIGLTSGYTMTIPNHQDGVEVHARFRREAIARGCLPVGMNEDVEEPTGFDRAKVIRKNIQDMLEAEDPDLFTKDGKPVLKLLADRCGFTIDRNEVNRVWDGMNKEAGEDDDAPTVIKVSAGA